jgi:2-polyprenyl-3-methyl-5-hydroxy-6-metoxy-1,4-benzoquinol methylase
MQSHAQQVLRRQRFEFGGNWQRFLKVVNERHIGQAEESLKRMLDVETLAGQRFLDIGSGSGLFSLGARRLGAVVYSFDFDPDSVACTMELKRRYSPDDPDWTISEGSVLDVPYLESLGVFDVVYAWGVLHHTGQLWRALENTLLPVRPDGTLFIAIYNDRGAESRRWRAIKRLYGRLPRALQPLLAVATVLPYEVKAGIRSLLMLRPGEYIRSWTCYDVNRGMNHWRDIVDWVGGYPYEVATPEQVIRFCESRGFVLRSLKRTAGLGNNEFVFARQGRQPASVND